ncbi:MAG TPA: SRPBCC domain-containing protein [Actinocrinis sp.]|jgi:hypothetical protein|uniref:SRPBCC domain-containing protein n=1 Tax=Actinocrinis sp. TaxID=1920516 RepID=UPI002DDD4FFD|nr:SRPBCC domain-containing protein [Actinocrinis sp.]HEV3169121.1 SRPBCC domain-containing protein [Actinocrinis sp.]
MRTISADIVIEATADRVWETLADFPRYVEWNPFIREAVGRAVPGERITVRIFRDEQKANTFRPRIVVAAPGRELRWLGHLLVPGVFDGEHSFELTPVDGGTRVVQSERFSGALVPLMGKVIEDTVDRFRALNRALKRRVEAEAVLHA